MKKYLLILLGVILVLTVVFLVLKQESSADTELSIMQLNDAVELKYAEYKQNPEANIAELKELLGVRKEKMLLLAQTDPEQFLLSILPLSVNNLPTELQTLIENKSMAAGKLKYKFTDDFEGNAEKELILEDSKDSLFYPFFADNPPIINQPVEAKINGWFLDDYIVVENGAIDDYVEILNLVSELQAASIYKTAIVAFNFLDDPIETATVEQIRQMVFTDNLSVKAYFNEVSNGKNTIGGKIDIQNGDVFGWYTIPYNKENCPANHRLWAVAAKELAESDGHNLSDYDTIVYLFPRVIGSTPNGCGWAGVTYGNKIFINGNCTTSIITHEINHYLGGFVGEGSALECFDDQGNRVPISNNCRSITYGDPFDVMGSGKWLKLLGQYQNAIPLHINNYYKLRKGWLSDRQIPEITTSGSYTIDAVETESTGLKGLKIPAEINPSTGEMTYYYLEFRKNDPAGFENLISPKDSATQGVSIRLSNGSSVSPLTKLIDTTPTTVNTDAPLLLNQVFIDSENNISITTTSVNSESATVQVEIGEVPCRVYPPFLTTTPVVAGPIDPGQTFTYNASLQNNNTEACQSSTFNISVNNYANYPGWTSSVSDPIIVLNPGERKDFTYSVTSPASALNDRYMFLLNAAGDETVVRGFNVIVGQLEPVIANLSTNRTSVYSGEIITYTINYTNGDHALYWGYIENIIPSGTTYIAGSASGNGTYIHESNRVRWNLGSLPSQSTGQVSFQVRVN